MKYFAILVAVLATCHVPTLAERIEIDIWNDLAAGWQLVCNNGYQDIVTDFSCVRLGATIPPEQLHGEVGFWTGCGSNCVMTYRLNPADVGFGFRAYLKDMQMIVRKNDLVNEYIGGDGWVEANIDLDFTTTISLILTQRTRQEFVILDKIFITREDPTTTTVSGPPDNSTTEEPISTTTTPTTTPEPTDPPTTLPPAEGVVIDKDADIPSNGRWEFDCPSGYAEETRYFDCESGGGIIIPEEDLDGQEGFWTKCTERCDIKYQVHPDDRYFKAQVYQAGGVHAKLAYNNEEWGEYPGEGWTEIKVYLGTGNVIKNITLSLDHTSAESFAVVDTITVEV